MAAFCGTIDADAKTAPCGCRRAACGGSRAVAQCTAAPPEAGGAYYQFLLGLHLEMPGTRRARPPRTSAPRSSIRSRRKFPAALAELYARLNRGRRRDRRRRARGQGRSRQSRSELDSRKSVRADGRGADDARAGSRWATRRRRSPTWNARTSTRIPACPVMLARLYLDESSVRQGHRAAGPFVAEQPDQIEAVALLADALSGDRPRGRGVGAAGAVRCGFARALRHARGGVRKFRPVARMRRKRTKAPWTIVRRACRCARSGPRRF